MKKPLVLSLALVCLFGSTAYAAEKMADCCCCKKEPMSCCDKKDAHDAHATSETEQAQH
jgi:hypothetical protein